MTFDYLCCKETQTVQTSALTDILYMYELRVAFFLRLQNSPYFLRIHDARTVKQKVWSEACDARAVRARVALSLLLRYTKPILRKITTVLQSTFSKVPFIYIFSIPFAIRNSNSSSFEIKKW